MRGTGKPISTCRANGCLPDRHVRVRGRLVRATEIRWPWPDTGHCGLAPQDIKLDPCGRHLYVDDKRATRGVADDRPQTFGRPDSSPPARRQGLPEPRSRAAPNYLYVTKQQANGHDHPDKLLRKERSSRPGGSREGASTGQGKLSPGRGRCSGCRADTTTDVIRISTANGHVLARIAVGVTRARGYAYGLSGQDP